VLLACGLGFWWLEPTTPTLADGMWLAFTTAATVGYGDVVPTTAASKIFSVFVVLLGFGVLTLVTAAIATKWVETEERLIEREIIHDMRHEMALLRRELAALRAEVSHYVESHPRPTPPAHRARRWDWICSSPSKMSDSTSSWGMSR
jgi:voltage-gated potassium channel